eukprot:TRINITY_DN3008_c0_g1_i2.p1 TRINITY_DN3008_c0_g1~~TRINITY_DN3008_c0_g1_i2.p1  ORF type:complete len:369 (+),score=84.17 TRINITY_DN3008_c0_g1_i2:183-1289(+)
MCKDEVVIEVPWKYMWSVDYILARTDILEDEVAKRIKQLRDKNEEFKLTMLNDKIVLALGVLHCHYNTIKKRSTPIDRNPQQEAEEEVIDWSVWIDSLPKEYSTLPLCWPLSRLMAAKEILPSALWESALKIQGMMKNIYLFLFQNDLLPADDAEEIVREKFYWSYASVQTRSWRHPQVGIVMIPFGDMFNHHDEACGVHFEDANPTSSFGMSLKASRGIKAGEEVFANYGPRSDEKVLFSYGYVPESNRYNFLPLKETSSGGMEQASQKALPGITASGSLNQACYQHCLAMLLAESPGLKPELLAIMNLLKTTLESLLKDYEQRTTTDNSDPYLSPCILLVKKRRVMISTALEFVTKQLSNISTGGS